MSVAVAFKSRSKREFAHREREGLNEVEIRTI
jgi:hypothetical protein